MLAHEVRRILRLELGAWLPPGQKLYILWRAPACLELVVPSAGELLRIGYEVAEALGLPYDHERQGIVWPREPEPLVEVLFRRLHGIPGRFPLVPL
jgi:hypothetical protein